MRILIKMSAIKQSSKSINGFLITLYLKDSKVLQIVAENSTNKQIYSFALNKSYVQHNLQFINLIKDPAQILDYFESTKEQKILFQNGQLVIQYSHESISIQLFKQPALANIYEELKKSQLETQQLKRLNQAQKSSFEQLQKNVKELAQKIQALVGKNQFYENVKNQNNLLGKLEGKNHQINNQLQQNKFKIKQIQDKDVNLQKKLQTLSNKHDDIQNLLKNLKLEEIRQKVDQLIQHQEIDNSQHTQMQKEIKEINTKIEQEIHKIQKIVKEGLQGSQVKFVEYLESQEKKEQESINNINSKLQFFEKQLKEQKEKLDQKIKDLIKKDSQNFQKLQKQAFRLTSQSKELIENKIKEVQTKNTDLKKKVYQLNTQNTSLHNQINQQKDFLQEKAKKLQVQNQKYQKKIVSLQKTYTQSSSSLSLKINELKQGHRKYSEDQQKKHDGLKNQLSQLKISQQALVKKLLDYYKNSVYNYNYQSSYKNQQLSKVLGSHPQNKDGDQVEVKSQQLSLRVNFEKQQTVAYNFVNKYQIKDIIHMTYRLKVIDAEEFSQDKKDKDNNNLIFIGFSDKKCLQTEVLTIETSWWKLWNRKYQKIILDGRHGFLTYVQKDQEIICTVDLISKIATYKCIREKTSQILQTKVQLDKWKGQGLFFEIATLSKITFDISV